MTRIRKGKEDELSPSLSSLSFSFSSSLFFLSLSLSLLGCGHFVLQLFPSFSVSKKWPERMFLYVCHCASISLFFKEQLLLLSPIFLAKSNRREDEMEQRKNTEREKKEQKRKDSYENWRRRNVITSMFHSDYFCFFSSSLPLNPTQMNIESLNNSLYRISPSGKNPWQKLRILWLVSNIN